MRGGFKNGKTGLCQLKNCSVSDRVQQYINKKKETDKFITLKMFQGERAT